jgi:branched-chain amino acid transport system substrate-binding protein
MYFDRVNAAGGINGRKIDLVTLDDRGNPTAAANTAQLMDQGVLALFGFYGSPQVTAAYPSIKDTDVLLFRPMAAADELRGPFVPECVFAMRPGYSEEAAAIARHAETLGARKFAGAAWHRRRIAGRPGRGRTHHDQRRRQLLAKAPWPAAWPAWTRSGASSRVHAGHQRAAMALLQRPSATVRAKGFRGPIYGFSNTGESLLAELLGPAGAGVVVARVVPKSDNAKVAVVRELAADASLAKLGKPNVYMLEGYIAARAFVEALRRVTGKEPNRARLKKAIEALDDVSIGGFRVHFTNERVGSRLVELSLIDSQGRIRD